MPDFGGPGTGPATVPIRTEAESLVGSDGNPFHGAVQEEAVVSVPYAQNLVDVEEYERIHNPQYQRDLADQIELMDLRKGTDAAKTFYMEEEAGAAGIGLVDDPETYPMAPKRHTMEHLREFAHPRPRTNLIGASEVRSSFLRARR